MGAICTCMRTNHATWLSTRASAAVQMCDDYHAASPAVSRPRTLMLASVPFLLDHINKFATWLLYRITNVRCGCSLIDGGVTKVVILEGQNRPGGRLLTLTTKGGIKVRTHSYNKQVEVLVQSIRVTQCVCVLQPCKASCRVPYVLCKMSCCVATQGAACSMLTSRFSYSPAYHGTYPDFTYLLMIIPIP